MQQPADPGQWARFSKWTWMASRGPLPSMVRPGLHLWSAPGLQEQSFAVEELGCSHLSDLFVRDFCPLAPMEFAPVCPYQVVDFNLLSPWHFQVFTPADLPFLPSRLITLKQPGG